jgi:hypothetical protein
MPRLAKNWNAANWYAVTRPPRPICLLTENELEAIDNELEAIDIELARTLDLTRFVDLSEVDVVYLDAPYYVAPDDKIGGVTFRVLREAMVKPISNSAALRTPQAPAHQPTICRQPIRKRVDLSAVTAGEKDSGGLTSCRTSASSAHPSRTRREGWVER